MQTPTPNPTKIALAIIIVLLLLSLIYINTQKKTITSINTPTATTTESLATTTTKKPSQPLPTIKNNTLTATSWVWKSTTRTNTATSLTPNNNMFVMTFGTDGLVTSTTDCNSVAGKYAVTRTNGITFTSMSSTLKACVSPTLEADYVQDLSRVGSFVIVHKNELQLNLRNNGGVMTFMMR